MDSKKVAAIKSLFGLRSDFSDTDTFREENIGLIEQMVTLLSSMTSGSDTSATTEMKPCLHEVLITRICIVHFFYCFSLNTDLVFYCGLEGITFVAVLAKRRKH